MIVAITIFIFLVIYFTIEKQLKKNIFYEVLFSVFAFGILVVLNFYIGKGKNDASYKEVDFYEENQFTDTVCINNPREKNDSYSTGFTKRDFTRELNTYLFYSKKHKKYMQLMLFNGYGYGSKKLKEKLKGKLDLAIRINRKQYQNPVYGTNKNPLPVFADDKINIEWQGIDFDSDFSQQSNQTNTNFIKQYLQFFMTQEEFKVHFSKK